MELVSQRTTDTASASASSLLSIFSYRQLSTKIRCLKQPLNENIREREDYPKGNLLSHFRWLYFENALDVFFVVLYVSLAFNDITSFCSLPSVTLSNFSPSFSMNDRSSSIVCYSDQKKSFTKLNTSRKPTAYITSRIQSYIHTNDLRLVFKCWIVISYATYEHFEEDNHRQETHNSQRCVSSLENL